MGPDLEYVVNSGAWSLAGLVVGYAVGRMERDIRDIKSKLYERKNRDDA